MQYEGTHIQMDILDNIQHGVIITDLRGHIVFWNRANEKIFGYKKSEIIGRPVRILYDDDEVMPFKKILKTCIKDLPVTGRWHGRQKNKNRVWLDVRAKIFNDEDYSSSFCIITICDIGKLKHTENRLKKNEALAQSILDSSADAIITVNKKGDILSFNKTGAKMFGYEKEELIGKNVKILMPLPYRDDHDNYMKRYLETGSAQIIGKGRELQGIKKNGKVFPLELAVSEVTWEGNRIFTGIIRDLSRRRELERQVLEIAIEERRRIGRELHDGLGQMLTGIRMLSENLARKLNANGLPGADEVKEISDMVKEADEYSNMLARGMTHIDLENLGLCDALMKLCRRVEKQSGVTCKFTSSGETGVGNHTIALHLYRIAQEAISNAIKHGNPNQVSVRLSSNPHHTSLTIEDDGTGLDHNERNKAGMGINIMNHRAGIMGGILEIERVNDSLTKVSCLIPNNQEQFN
jgi:two-component system, LuxR family, sensor kinase FixL